MFDTALCVCVCFFCYVGVVISGIATSMGQESGDREPGDFGIDPLQLAGNPTKKAKLQLQEIKNGRLAMWAAAGMIMQGVTTDQSALDNLFVVSLLIGLSVPPVCNNSSLAPSPPRPLHQ